MLKSTSLKAANNTQVINTRVDNSPQLNGLKDSNKNLSHDNKSNTNFVLCGGSSNLPLAKLVSDKLDTPFIKPLIINFSDGEKHVKIEDGKDIKGKNAIILQSTSKPANDNIMELVLMADALKRASADKVTAVVPYFGYARQDRPSNDGHAAISSKVVASMLEAAKIDEVICLDLHATQIVGFFNIPIRNLTAKSDLLKEVNKKQYADIKFVAPDAGGIARARAFAQTHSSDAEIAIVDKHRPRPNESHVMNIIGDVAGKNCIIVDDMVDTGGTLVNAAKALKERGAATVDAYCTHGVLSGNAVEKINKSKYLDSLTVTNTIKPRADVEASSKINIVDISNNIADNINGL